jgi:hypothetical protein
MLFPLPCICSFLYCHTPSAPCIQSSIPGDREYAVPVTLHMQLFMSSHDIYANSSPHGTPITPHMRGSRTSYYIRVSLSWQITIKAYHWVLDHITIRVLTFLLGTQDYLQKTRRLPVSRIVKCCRQTSHWRQSPLPTMSISMARKDH